MSDVIAGKISEGYGTWHILEATGRPRCHCILYSAFDSSKWEVKLLSNLTVPELNKLCDRCAEAKDWLSDVCFEHLRAQFKIAVKTRTVLNSSTRVFTGMGGNSSDWRGRKITDEQVQFLSRLGALGYECNSWSRGFASDAIDWFKERKRELSLMSSRARFYADDENDTAYIIFINNRYTCYTFNDITYTLERKLSDLDIVETFEPMEVSIIGKS